MRLGIGRASGQIYEKEDALFLKRTMVAAKKHIAEDLGPDEVAHGDHGDDEPGHQKTLEDRRRVNDKSFGERLAVQTQGPHQAAGKASADNGQNEVYNLRARVAEQP